MRAVFSRALSILPKTLWLSRLVYGGDVVNNSTSNSICSSHSNDYYTGEDKDEFDSYGKALQNNKNIGDIFKSNEYKNAREEWKAQNSVHFSNDEIVFQNSFLKLLRILQYSDFNYLVKRLTLECFNYLKVRMGEECRLRVFKFAHNGSYVELPHRLVSYIYKNQDSLQKNEIIKMDSQLSDVDEYPPSLHYFYNMLDDIATEYIKNEEEKRNKATIKKSKNSGMFSKWANKMIDECFMKLSNFFTSHDKENMRRGNPTTNANPSSNTTTGHKTKDPTDLELAEFRNKYLTELVKIIEWCFWDNLISRIPNQYYVFYNNWTKLACKDCKLDSDDIKVLRAICSSGARGIRDLKFSNVKFIDKDTCLAELYSQYFVHIDELTLNKCQLKTIPDMCNLFSRSLRVLNLNDNAIEDLNIKTIDYNNANPFYYPLEIHLRGNPLKTVSGCGLINRLNLVKFILDQEEKLDQGFKDNLTNYLNEFNLNEKKKHNVSCQRTHKNYIISFIPIKSKDLPKRTNDQSDY